MLASRHLHLTLPVVDLDRARRFYGETLGLKPGDLPALVTNGDMAAFEAGNGTLLFLYCRDHPTTADHTVATFWVDDLEGELEELRERGVVFEQYDLPGLRTDERGIAETGPTRAAWFKDTEGNILAIGGLA